MTENNKFFRVLFFLCICLLLSFLVFLLCSCSAGNTVNINEFPNSVAENAQITSNKDTSEALSEDIKNEYKMILDEYVNNPNQQPNMIYYTCNRLQNLGVSCSRLGQIGEYCYFDLPATQGYEEAEKLLLVGNAGQFQIDNSNSGQGTNIISYSYDNQAEQFKSTSNLSINGIGGINAATAIAIAKDKSLQHGNIRIFLYSNNLDFVRQPNIRAVLDGYDYAIDLSNTNHVGVISTMFPESDSGTLSFTIDKEAIPSDYISFSVDFNGLGKCSFTAKDANKRISSFEVLQKISNKLSNDISEFRFSDIQMQRSFYSNLFTQIPTNLRLFHFSSGIYSFWNF